MIFNSISKELNQNGYVQPSSSRVYTQPTYFPNHQAINQRNMIPSTTQHKNESAISKMNQKLQENIDYIRFKDRLRSSELKTSRVSNSSNRSLRSNHSSKERLGSASKISNAYVPPISKIKQYAPVNYFPRAEKKYIQQPVWSSQLNHNYKPMNQHHQHHRAHHQQQNPYLQDFSKITRQPITIIDHSYNTNQMSNLKNKPERDSNFSLSGSKHSHQSEDFMDFKQQKIKSSFPQEENYQKNNREWINSFGSNNPLTSDKAAEKLINEIPAKKQVEPETLSPLPLSKKSNHSIIVAAALIALGLIIFLVQITK